MLVIGYLGEEQWFILRKIKIIGGIKIKNFGIPIIIWNN